MHLYKEDDNILVVEVPWTGLGLAGNIISATEDMQALITKISKSTVAPLPAKYSGAFRGLVKSLLRKNPELRPSAAELLRHPHLQPYIEKIHLQTRNPRCDNIPDNWDETDSNCIDKATLPDAEDENTLNPSISDTELDSFHNDDRIKPTLAALEKRLAKLKAATKAVPSKASDVTLQPRLTRAKTIGNIKRRTELSRNRESPPSRTPVKRSVSATRTRRMSMPSVARPVIQELPCRPTMDILKHIKSPDISVNSPRIDRIAEFPLASYEEPYFSSIPRRRSWTPRQDSSASPRHDDNCSITKDKFSVQFDDRGSSDMRRPQFDTSSYQQRAEALEGLLEFSAKLLQQERLDELVVLLKPFGPEKVSPRETAIWLSKSFKENSVKQEN